MENDELAIENLTRLLEQEKIEKQDLADATSILAQAFINLKQIDSAIAKLEIAAQATKSKDELGRYKFIQGQLYNHLEKKDSANLAFDKVIELNRQTPRIYLINAYLEKAKNFDYEEGNKLEFLELLTDLEENREHYNNRLLTEGQQLLAKPGDVLMYDGRTLHSTMPNKSSEFRSALLINVLKSDIISRVQELDGNTDFVKN